MSETLQWIVTPSEEALRLDTFLAHHLPALSRRERAALIANKQVLLNRRPAPKARIVHAHDCVTVAIPLTLTPCPTLPVLVEYADKSIVIVNKPAGLASVALRHTDTQTVANFLAARFPETLSAGPRQLEAGLVHRLDTETSGLLLAACTPTAYTTLRPQFRNRSVGKAYLAIVRGALKVEGQIALPLAPAGPRGQRMRVAAPGQGQEAITVYAPVEYLPEHTIVRVTIATGVRHQIRAHLAALGHPIVGDTIYGTAIQQSTRLYLHAETLTFRHPTTGQGVSFTGPAPADFSAMLGQLRSQRDE